MLRLKIKVLTNSRVCRGIPDLQQPTGSQIIRLYMGIYRKIDKTVKMYINSYKNIQTWLNIERVLFSYCFLRYKYHFSKF